MKRIILTTCIAAAWMAGTASGALLAGYAPGTPTDGRVAIGEYGFGGAYPALQARSFMTGGEAYFLDSVDLGAYVYQDYGMGSLALALYTDNSSAPGSVVAGGENLLDVDYGSSPVALEANTLYWFVASVDQSQGDSRYWWDLTASSAFDSDVAGTDLPLSFATKANGAWDISDGASLPMSVYGSVIPEPGTISLTGVGLGIVWLTRRRRMKKGPGGPLQLAKLSPHARSFVKEERQLGLS